MRTPMRGVSSVLQTFEEGAHGGKWWYSTVHLVTPIIGAGVLGLPSAMVYLGWWGGMTMLTVSYGVTLSTLWQMIHMHHSDDSDERIDRFPDLGKKAFGLPGWYSTFILQMVLQVVVDIAYMITGGYAISLIFHSLDDYRGILIFAVAQFLVCLIPDFSSLTWVSTLATFMSIGYSIIIWGSAIYLRNPGASYEIPELHRIPRTFNALGRIIFSFGGQNVVLEVQSLMKAPSTRTMWHGALVTYAIVALCYFPVAVLGYWAFGNLTCYENVLMLLKSPEMHRWPFYAANAMLVLHLTGGYQVYALPVYEMLEPLFERVNRSERLSAFVLSRYTYIALTCLVATVMPFFTDIVGFIGGLVIAPTSFFVPCILWLAIKKPEPFSLTWLANIACIVCGAILTVLAVTGSLWDMFNSLQSKTHRPFHFPNTYHNCTV